MALIFVVEDDPAVALGVRTMLESENHDVESFRTGEEALEARDLRYPDLVLLDITLPGMSGYDICRRLRETGYNEPVIMCSARTQPVDRIVGLEVGADDYVTKPFNTRELTARICAHLRRAERLRGDHAHPDGHRHLLAILFSDICGYSRIMHEDEGLGLRLLKEHNTLMDRVFTGHAGVVVEIIGDAFLVRFESAVEAVEAGMDALRTLARRNAGAPDGENIQIRIGVHLGDVLDYGRSIKGDSVNIAARIQHAAGPGTLCISDDVHRIVSRKTAFVFTDLGEQSFKNIRLPVRVWEVREGKE